MYLLYIDPGSGSLLFQALLSGLLTVVVFFKRIVAFIKFKFGKHKMDDSLENIDEIDQENSK
ncbi:MAG: hypothetical protein RL387_1767 [Bacteroidota bacterium]|jgi:hypothetical protein